MDPNSVPVMDPDFNVADWLVDRQVGQGRGDAVALEAASGRLTYAELAALTGSVAAGLRELGLHRYDRVVFVTKDDVAMFAGILGAIRGGFVAVPVSTMLGPVELGEIIRDCGAVVLVASEPFADNVAQAAASCPELTTVVWDEPGLGRPLRQGLASCSFADLVARGEAAPAPERAPVAAGEDAWALWLYTSGTTGKPKGAMHRHLNLRLVAECYGWKVLGIQPEDRCLSVAKLFFAYGIGNSMFFPLSVGATSILEPARPTPAGIAERIRATRPTLFFGVPTFYADLLKSDVPDDLFEGVRLGASAGEALPEGVQARMKFRFDLDIIDGLGSTECLHIFLSNRPCDIRPGTSGRPVPGYQLDLRDLDDRPVPDGSRARSSCLAVRSRWATGGARRRPGRSSRVGGSTRGTPTCGPRTATTPVSDEPTTCSRRAASGCRPTKWSLGCWSTRRSPSVRWWPCGTTTAWRSLSPAWWPGARSAPRSWRRGAGPASPRSSDPGASSSSTSCPAPRPASCSVTCCAASSSG